MRFLCDNCKSGYEIERNRKRLNDVLIRKKYVLLDDEVIQLSEFLDDSIYKCILCKKKLNETLKLKTSIKNIFGMHTRFYYYGQQHLFINMHSYILDGIRNNEIIYCSMEKDTYNKLLTFLKSNGISLENVKYKNFKKLIYRAKNRGGEGLKEEIEKICLENKVKKYNGVRLIGQPSFMFQTDLQKDFLDFEYDLNKAIHNLNISLLYIYDLYDNISENNFVNKKVIKKTLCTNNYIFKDLYME